MKKTSLVLIGLACAFCAGCGGSYDAERNYWHVQKKHAAAMKDPASASSADFASAVADLSGAVARYPQWRNSGQIQFFVGRMHAQRRDFAAAEEAFTKVYRNYPQLTDLCAQSLFAIGKLYEEQGSEKEAVRKYREVVERYPETLTGLQVPLYIPLYYQNAKKPDQSRKEYASAERHYVNLLETNPYGKQVPVLQALAIAADGQAGKWSDALVLLEKLVKKYPDSEGAPIALYRMAIIQRDVFKRNDKAMELYQRIITKYPNSKLGKNAQFELGGISAMDGKIDQSREEFAKVLERYPDDISLCAMAQLSVAVGYERQGKWSDAVREYRKLEKDYPETIESFQAPLFIARHELAEGNKEEGAKVVDQAVARFTAIANRKNRGRVEAAAQEFIASAYVLQEKWPQAIAALERLRSRFPNDPRSELALVRIGIIYQQGLKNIPAARDVYLRFTQEYPDHRMTPIVKDMLEKISRT